MTGQRIRRTIERLGIAGCAAVMVAIILGGWVVAQSVPSGTFSKIFLGSATGPVISTGSAAPAAPCKPGSVYLQKASASSGAVWLCKSDENSTTSGQWQTIGSGNTGDYLITDYGAVCDGSTDNGVIFNNISTAISETDGKTGTIVLPVTAGSNYCAFSGTWRIGPSTTPILVERGVPPGITDLSITLTAPRTATIGFTASSTTITFSGTDLTANDVGNEVFYGTTDAAYSAFDARTIVPTPTYSCTIASVNTSGHTAVCTPPTTGTQGTRATAGPTNTLVTMTSTTTGSRTAFISNDHDFVVTDANDLGAEHVGKSVQLIVPVLRAPLNLINTARNIDAQVATGTAPCTNDATTGAKVGLNQGAWSAVTTYASTARVTNQGALWVSLQGSNLNHAPPTLPTLSDAWWHYQDSFQCQNGGNLKLKQFAARITSVSDTKHGKLQLDALVTGNSNWVGQFPDSSHTTETNSGSYAGHEWCHGLTTANCYFSTSKHLNHAIDYTAFTTAYKNSSSSASEALSDIVEVFPYFQPVDTGVVHISVRGQGPYSTLLKWLGPGDEPDDGQAVVAIAISRNKEFQMSGFSLFNAETCGGGSCYDTEERVGMYFGGLPGFGTQTFAFIGTQLAVGGFNRCVMMGDNLGGETSDESFNELQLTYCNRGLSMSPGSFNSLDVKVYNVLGGFNKVGIENWDGNLIVKDGSFSYNAIDFLSTGFGPFGISGMRSEGPGRFVFGDEPGLNIRDNNVNEPQGARPTTGTVTCTPSDVRNVTVDIGADTGGPPINTFFPLTFGVGDIVASDVGKSIVLELTGGNVVGVIHRMTSTTTANFVLQYGTPAVESGKTARLYDTDLCDMTWASGQFVANDVGGAVMMPNGDTHADYGSLVKVYLEEVLSATTGRGRWLISQGGPVIHGGTSDVDPVFFDNISIELTGGNYATIIDNFLSTSLIRVRDGGGGGLQVTNSTVAAAPMLSHDNLPARMDANGGSYRIDLSDLEAIPAPTSNGGHTTGIQFPGTMAVLENRPDGQMRLTAYNNMASLHAGPSWPLMDVIGQWWRGDFQAIQKRPVQAASFTTGHDYFQDQPTWPSGPEQPIGWVTSISSAVLSNSRNLIAWGKFNTSDTLSVTFERTETLDYVYAAGANYDPVRRIVTFLTTVNHFQADDVGRQVCYTAQATSDYGAQTVCGIIDSIVDTTHITVKQAPGVRGLVTGNANVTFAGAIVGSDEPNTRYRIAGYSCDAPEAVGFTAIATTGFTATSSNATSTATCRFFLVHY